MLGAISVKTTVVEAVVTVTTMVDVAVVTTVVSIPGLGIELLGCVETVVAGTVIVDLTITGHAPAAVTTLLSRVTAPVSAMSEPEMVVPVVAVMEAEANMEPMSVEPVPSVAEDPTCHTTLHARAPLISTTLDSLAVMSVEPIWKTKSAFGSSSPSKTRVPVSAAEVAYR